MGGLVTLIHIPIPSVAADPVITATRARMIAPHKGASIYDVRSGWGMGVPKKQTKGTKSADL